ncbi:PRC-barrel domain-containing protein [Massilia horti]|uniref:PRC-barrel domain containing protein n=1 Tax=Massilia horti TaxID=2562153 RepID=A0A4Y9SY85_9BURK|nr:PRC-barrel domain-containing protein [Massilia horti]TFW30507.1 PRC-barrel domain containing protein [Massilia horti]TFW30574.1 PRC-barrel domain containing protein [Massilia horti]
MKFQKGCLALCVGYLCASAAWSQTPDAKQNPPVAGASALGVSVVEMENVVLGWSAKRDLLGKPVINDRKERIGTIDDLIITPSTTGKLPRATVAIIGVGGFIGIGKRDVAIPVEQIQHTDNTFVLPGATKDALKAMPPFEYRKK